MPSANGSGIAATAANFHNNPRRLIDVLLGFAPTTRKIMDDSLPRGRTIPRLLRTDGRLRRREYALGLVVLIFSINMLGVAGSLIPVLRPILAMIGMPLLGYIFFCIGAQRAHDAGQSGWMVGAMMGATIFGSMLAAGGGAIRPYEPHNANMLLSGAFALLFTALVINIILLFGRDRKANEWGPDPRIT